MESGSGEIADALSGGQPVPADVTEDSGVINAVDCERWNSIVRNDFCVGELRLSAAVEADGGDIVERRERIPLRVGERRFDSQHGEIPVVAVRFKCCEVCVVESEPEAPGQHLVLFQFERRDSIEADDASVGPDQFQRQCDLAVAFPVRGEQRKVGASLRTAGDVGAVGHLQHPVFAVAVPVDHRAEVFSDYFKRGGGERRGQSGQNGR